ncbi:cytochrome P450 [Phototrophicus methaneseepsis]|uniref:Cytochrome P450 n=1 Tax=Phototrophicus methaneseepsis TaxID=2710758 RepID=A0A7S8E9T2_9CHLR|nr:cytochrome P450 [Phototrophicus methaneseepsis]QPC82883.1 cytochrome P450 [Phototrophicus methaneseepsis]
MATHTQMQYPLFSTATRANPQAVYNQMREHDPIWAGYGPNSGNRIWFFVDYEDVVAVLKNDKQFIKDARNLPPEVARRYTSDTPDPVFDAINRHLLGLDAPDHTRLRRLVHKVFTPRAIQALIPRIQAIADELLDQMAGQNEADLINAFTFPLPITVIAEMLGVEAAKRDQFKEWTTELLFGTDFEKSRIAAMSFVMYINELIERREHEDTGDILSGLVRAEEEGDKLNREELVSMVFLLLVAGHETTVNLMGNGMLTLMQHPQQFEMLKQQPDLMKSAVEEMLRYNGPVETPTTRLALETIDYKGHRIECGDVVLPSLLGANRDPLVFDDPNTFDITRSQNPHVAFGLGVHYCVGAPLARLEATIALTSLIARYPDMQLNTPVEALEWNPSLLIHGMKALPVRY